MNRENVKIVYYQSQLSIISWDVLIRVPICVSPIRQSLLFDFLLYNAQANLKCLKEILFLQYFSKTSLVLHKHDEKGKRIV